MLIVTEFIRSLMFCIINWGLLMNLSIQLLIFLYFLWVRDRWLMQFISFRDDLQLFWIFVFPVLCDRFQSFEAKLINKIGNPLSPFGLFIRWKWSCTMELAKLLFGQLVSSWYPFLLSRNSPLLAFSHENSSLIHELLSLVVLQVLDLTNYCRVNTNILFLNVFHDFWIILAGIKSK